MADAGGVQLSPSQSADQVKFVTEKEPEAEADAFTIEVPLPAEQEQDESLGLAALETSTLMYSTN